MSGPKGEKLDLRARVHGAAAGGLVMGGFMLAGLIIVGVMVWGSLLLGPAVEAHPGTAVLGTFLALSAGAVLRMGWHLHAEAAARRNMRRRRAMAPAEDGADGTE